MRYKKLLAIILLSLSFCFVIAGVGYGEIEEWMDTAKVSYIDFKLLQAKVDYMMANPESFLDVYFHYDPDGSIGKAGKLPGEVSTKDKIIITIEDIGNRFSYKTGMILLDAFKGTLETIYSYIIAGDTDLANDIYGELFTIERIPLAYFYQGVYHLWEE